MSDLEKSKSAKRKCGTCTACCTALGVVEFAKAPGTRCGQVCRAGCRIYALRPPTCQQFECLWLQGVGGQADRPDRTGVVLSATSSRDFGTVVQVHEVTNGAWERSARSQRLGEILARDHIVIRLRGSRRTILGGPQHLVERAVAHLQRAKL
jgi:hypothetical protein